MKTIGLIGGMSWESTVSYYREINEGVKRALGGWHSARMVLYSVDFHDVEILQREEKWDETADILGSAAQRVEAAGADFLVICTNTMHKVVPQIEKHIDIPILHIADATARRIKSLGYRRVGLLGTNYTMEQDFYKGRLKEKHGIDTIVPGQADRGIVHDVIYDELCKGTIAERSRCEFVRIISMLNEGGAEAVILGCTEIALLIRQEHTPVPLLDTVLIHAEEAVRVALD